MSGKPQRYGGRRAVALLASCFVCLGGAFACTVIGLGAGQPVEAALLGGAGGLTTFVLIVWFLQAPTTYSVTTAAWSWLARRHRRRVEYHLRPRQNLPPVRAPAPPTVEHVRELSQGLHTWVPSNDRSRGKAS